MSKHVISSNVERSPKKVYYTYKRTTKSRKVVDFSRRGTVPAKVKTFSKENVE